MRRIVAPAGTALSTVLSLELAAAYLINSILKLGQPITHLCKLPVGDRRECCRGLLKWSSLMLASRRPHAILQGCLSESGPSSFCVC